jgi:hypothetical protein
VTPDILYVLVSVWGSGVLLGAGLSYSLLTYLHRP